MTTEPTTVPAWVNVDAVLTPEDLEAIAAARLVAADALRAAIHVYAKCRPIADLWEQAVWRSEGGGDALNEVLRVPTGFEELGDLLVLAGRTILDAWDEASSPDGAYTDTLAKQYASEFPGLVRE